MNRRVTRLTAILMCLMLAAPAALAQNEDASANLPAWLATFDGQVRVYEFDRFHNNNLDNPSVRSAFATSAKLFAQTKSLYGFSTGLGLYAASNFGFSPQPAGRDGSLMGTATRLPRPQRPFCNTSTGFSRHAWATNC